MFFEKLCWFTWQWSRSCRFDSNLSMRSKQRIEKQIDSNEMFYWLLATDSIESAMSTSIWAKRKNKIGKNIRKESNSKRTKERWLCLYLFASWTDHTRFERQRIALLQHIVRFSTIQYDISARKNKRNHKKIDYPNQCRSTRIADSLHRACHLCSSFLKISFVVNQTKKRKTLWIFVISYFQYASALWCLHCWLLQTSMIDYGGK